MLKIMRFGQCTQVDLKRGSSMVGTCLHIVYNVETRKDMDSSIQEKSDSGGGANKKRNQNFINTLKFKISTDPIKSMKKLDPKLEVVPMTIRTAVNGDLRPQILHQHTKTPTDRTYEGQRTGEGHKDSPIPQAKWVHYEDFL